jgi:hypothetical protein
MSYRELGSETPWSKKRVGVIRDTRFCDCTEAWVDVYGTNLQLLGFISVDDVGMDGRILMV